jgi:predicted SprT family Zn-dependent metalloprotease
MHTLTEFKVEVLNKLNQASEKYGALPSVAISFDLTGRAAGMAGRKNGQYYIQFNKAAIQMDWDHLFNDTIPHEVAHIVQFFYKHLADPQILKGKRGWVNQAHGPKFKQICRELGGSGDRCHTIALPKAKVKTIRRHIYTDNLGREVKFTTVTHNRVQRLFKQGVPRIPLNGGGHVCKCDYKGVKIIR